MASNLTNYVQTKLLDHVLGLTTYTKPTTVYLALFSSDPTETGSAGTEITGGGYARQSITFSASTNSGGLATTSNSGSINFPVATANYPAPVTHIGIMDAVTVGNMLWYGPLSASKTILQNDQFQVGATKLSITLG